MLPHTLPITHPVVWLEYVLVTMLHAFATAISASVMPEILSQALFPFFLSRSFLWNVLQIRLLSHNRVVHARSFDVIPNNNDRNTARWLYTVDALLWTVRNVDARKRTFRNHERLFTICTECTQCSASYPAHYNWHLTPPNCFLVVIKLTFRTPKHYRPRAVKNTLSWPYKMLSYNQNRAVL